MKISIVTPTFNALSFLRHSADSILSQSGDFTLQWFIKDAGSTDGTVEWLGSLSDPRVTWQSSPDKGQSDAINHAISSCDGDILAWLNADDLYAADALNTVAHAFKDNPQSQWLVGRYEIIDLAGRPIRQSVVNYKRKRLERFSMSQLMTENVIPQPAVFWRRSLWDKVGPLDTSLYYTMDYDLWLRMARQGPPLVIDALLARFRHHEGSKSGKLNRAQFDEQFSVMKRYGPGGLQRVRHQFHVEKVVWAYRVMKWLRM